MRLSVLPFFYCVSSIVLNSYWLVGMQYNSLNALRIDLTENHRLPNVMKGSIIWLVRDGQIYEVTVLKEDGVYTYEKRDELTASHFSCPLAYLNQTEAINPAWRAQVVEYINKRNHVEKALIAAYNSIQDEPTKRLKVYFRETETTKHTIPYVILEGVTPFQGRYQGRLYGREKRFPIKGVDRWEIIENKASLM